MLDQLLNITGWSMLLILNIMSQFAGCLEGGESTPLTSQDISKQQAHWVLQENLTCFEYGITDIHCDSHIIVTSLSGTAISYDSGRSWIQPKALVYNHAADLFKSDNGTLYMIRNKFTSRNTNHRVFFRLFESKDFGLSWNEIPLPFRDQVNAYAIDETRNLTYYSQVAEPGIVCFDRNTGDVTKLAPELSRVVQLGVSETGVIFAYEKHSGLWRSIQGDDWTLISQKVIPKLSEMYRLFYSEDLIVLGSERNNFISRNMGASFELLEPLEFNGEKYERLLVQKLQTDGQLILLNPKDRSTVLSLNVHSGKVNGARFPGIDDYLVCFGVNDERFFAGSVGREENKPGQELIKYGTKTKGRFYHSPKSTSL